MKHYLLLVVIIFNLSDGFCQTLDEKLTKHFENNTAELYRYSGLATYGESQTKIEQNQINSEVALFEEIKKSDLLNKPTNLVFALCHNIQIHSPEKGKEFLKLLNKPTKNKATIISLFSEMIFFGAFGEQLALDNLTSANSDWTKIWSYYLSKNATYTSSVPVIEKFIADTTDPEVKVDLISSLMYVSDPNSVPFIKKIIDTTKNDEIQAKAIFVFTELTGFNGLNYLKTIKTVGEKSKEEQRSSMDWLKTETGPTKIYGTEVGNDGDFIMRFGDIRSPAMNWLESEGLLSEKAAKKPIVLSKEKKDKLLDLLIESKGFGLEAVKGTLFLSIEPADIDKLLYLRQLSYYSPNRFTESRMHTLGVFIRHLKRQ